MGKELTTELVFMRSKVDRLDMVKNLNLWGNDISGVGVLREMPNVEVLSLSVNKISSLEDFKYCSKLTELYLRKNLVSDLEEVKYLKGLKNLRVLWLWDNPCAEHSNYRSFVISKLPQLVKLDNQAITPEEKASAAEAAPAVSGTPPVHDNPGPSRATPKYERRESPLQRAERPMTSENRRQQANQKNENILCAILALLKELDEGGLELVKREIDRKITR